MQHADKYVFVILFLFISFEKFMILKLVMNDT